MLSLSPWGDLLITFGVAMLLLMIAFGIGSWLEKGGKSDPEDYSDDD